MVATSSGRIYITIKCNRHVTRIRIMVRMPPCYAYGKHNFNEKRAKYSRRLSYSITFQPLYQRCQDGCRMVPA
jgi:hypothetical protein